MGRRGMDFVFLFKSETVFYNSIRTLCIVVWGWVNKYYMK